MSNNVKAVIYGLEGLALTEEEKEFFAAENPAGFILFARNVETPDQVKALCAELRELVGWYCPILIDQEGGRVARLRPPHWPEFPSMEPFAEQASCGEIEQACQGSYENALALSDTLLELGINVNCAPVADLRIEGADDIIGNRSFGSDPELVAKLAAEMARGFQEKGVTAIVKHIPGHGRALCDSHKELPIVDCSLERLQETDFKAFALLKDIPWAMTAHIIYNCLDAHSPATQSAEVIRYIRDIIGFKGILISDDLSMEALKGSFQERAAKSLEAGCDLVLHCNGKMEEMLEVSKGVTKEIAQERLC